MIWILGVAQLDDEANLTTNVVRKLRVDRRSRMGILGHAGNSKSRKRNEREDELVDARNRRGRGRGNKVRIAMRVLRACQEKRMDEVRTGEKQRQAL